MEVKNTSMEVRFTSMEMMNRFHGAFHYFYRGNMKLLGNQIYSHRSKNTSMEARLTSMEVNNRFHGTFQQLPLKQNISIKKLSSFPRKLCKPP